MHKRVIVAYDGSREGRAALLEGAMLVRLLGAELYILAVVPETPGLRVAEGAYAGAMVYQDETYKALLEEAVQGLGRYGLHVRGKLVRGEPPQEIAAYAREIRASLVVVGYRRQNLLQRWWSGPNGAYLSDYLGCSLLIAKAEISMEEFNKAMGEPLEVTA